MATNHHEYLTPEQLADELQLPVRTLYAWRYQGQGPKVLKVGRHLRYRRSDIDAWIEAKASAA